MFHPRGPFVYCT